MARWIWNKRLKLDIPDNWNQVSYEKAMRILETDDLSPSKVIAVLCDIEEEIVRQSGSKEQIQALYEVFPYWSSFPVIEQPTMPFMFSFKDKLIKVEHDWSGVFDLGKVCTVGQIEDMINHVRNCHKPDMENVELFKIYPVLIAIYIQPIYDNEAYSYERAMRLVADVKKQISIVVALNVGGFFLLNLHALTNGKRRDYQKRNSMIRSLRQAWNSFKKALALQRQLMRSRGM